MTGPIPFRGRDDSSGLRVPPTNARAEQMVLGMCLDDNRLFHRVAEYLTADDFSSLTHQKIFVAIGQVIGTGSTANPVTLQEQFNRDEVMYLARLATGAALGTNIDDYGRVVLNLANWRRLIVEFEDGIERGYNANFATSAEDFGMRHQARVTQILQRAMGNSWLEPANLLGSDMAPPFPIDFLPGALADFALDQAKIMQAPVDFMGIPLLVAAGTVIGKDFLMAPKALASWTERPCLWGGCVATVGSNKTASFNAALAPIWRLQQEFRKAHHNEMKVYRLKAAQAKEALKQWEKALAKNGKEMQEMPEPPEPPVLREIIGTDATQERLVEMMQQNPRGIMLYRDELSGWFNSFNQYRPGSDEQFFLQCHAGGPWSHHRKNGDFFVSDLFLGIFGGFQPDVITEVLARHVDNGLAARFSLLVWPEPNGRFEYVDRRRDSNAAARVESVFRELAALDPERFVGPLREGETHYQPFRFTPGAAQEIFREWLIAHHAMLESIHPGDRLIGHFHKYDGLFARLAIVHHLIRYVLGEPVEPARVDHVSAVAVRDFIVDYLQGHALKIYRHLGKGTSFHGARRIAEWIVGDRSMTGFTAREVRRKQWSGLTEGDQVDAALDHLENVGNWIRAEEPSPSGPKGGRPSRRYQVNPLVRRLFHFP
jgi:hypothetical protein